MKGNVGNWIWNDSTRKRGSKILAINERQRFS